MDKLQSCPCGIAQEYQRCCGRYIDAGEWPEMAEELMRSRYCAYVQQNTEYLLRTWDDSSRPLQLDLNSDVALKWLGLKVVATEAGGVLDDRGMVEFVARYKLNGKAVRLHECSRFSRHHGRWFYVDGRVE